MAVRVNQSSSGGTVTTITETGIFQDADPAAPPFDAAMFKIEGSIGSAASIYSRLPGRRVLPGGTDHTLPVGYGHDEKHGRDHCGFL